MCVCVCVCVLQLNDQIFSPSLRAAAAATHTSAAGPAGWGGVGWRRCLGAGCRSPMAGRGAPAVSAYFTVPSRRDYEKRLASGGRVCSSWGVTARGTCLTEEAGLELL